MSKIRIEQFNAVVDGINEDEAWGGVEAFLMREFADSEGILDQAGYDAALAQVQADESEKISGPRAFIAAAQAELDYLDTTIPLIDSMTAVQVRSVVERLARENREIIRALLYVARRLT